MSKSLFRPFDICRIEKFLIDLFEKFQIRILPEEPTATAICFACRGLTVEQMKEIESDLYGWYTHHLTEDLVWNKIGSQEFLFALTELNRLNETFSLGETNDAT